MKATRFEYQHQTLMHLLLVGLTSLTYLRDRVDIVWALVRNHSDSASWERLVFGFGALMLLGSAVLETWAGARTQVSAGPDGPALDNPSQYGYGQQQTRLARILLVPAVGLLLPLSGAIILLTGETILIWRLYLRGHESTAGLPLPPRSTGVRWGSGFRIAASKWGLTLSMIVFVLDTTRQNR